MHKITSFVIAEAVVAKRGKEAPPTLPVRSAPHYFEQSVPAQSIVGQKKAKLGTLDVELLAKAYSPDVVVVEGSIEVPDMFGSDILELKEQLLQMCYKFAGKFGGKEEPSEEYTVYQISAYQGDPELFLEKNSSKIASLLKSEKLELDEKEVEHTLAHQLKYAKDDLLIYDWDGAFVFDPEGEFGETLELLELANYQLLRYRMLDQRLDVQLGRAYQLVKTDTSRWFRTKDVTQAFREVIKIRADAIAHFEALEREIKLIGDWYSARLYEALSRKFRLGEWRQTIRDKLESLEDVYTIVSENLGMSRMQVLEFIQIGAFFVLQIGWFILIVLEFVYFTR